MAAICEVVGSIRSSISKIGACLPYDNVHLIRGIYVRGLDFQLSERQFFMEFARFGEITAVSFPRDSHWWPVGYAMIEYGHPNQAAAAIFGLHGWCIGDRELEVTLMHRRIENTNTRGSFGPRSGSNVWSTGD
jgi:RNA recognition motif-containing protein